MSKITNFYTRLKVIMWSLFILKNTSEVLCELYLRINELGEWRVNGDSEVAVFLTSVNVNHDLVAPSYP